MKTFVKDPDAVLDYVWDWTDWLDQDVIQSHTFTLPTDLTKVDDSEADGKVTLWMSGGVAKKSYIVGCEIVTAGGRTDERSAIFNVRDR